MGNTGSTNNQDVNQQYNFYDSQLNEYKRMIIAQQEQINQLSSMNIKQNISSRQTSNMFFNEVPNQQQNNPQIITQSTPYPRLQSQFNTINTNLIENQKPKFNPYKILGIDKNFDEVSLKKAYLRKAMKTHPDRGGSPEEFQKVSIAYTLLLKKLKDLKNNHGHNDLRNHSKNYMQSQKQDTRVNVNMTENFDVNLFNKVYEENKINTPFDDGYGNWMSSNAIEDKKQQKLFDGKFNRNLFNHEFEKYKKDQQKKQGSQLVKYDNPNVDISFRGKDSLSVLGQNKVNDFSGDTGMGLGFRDYKDAFTNSCLIDVNAFQDKGRPRDINTMESSRSNISYQMSEQDQKKILLQQLREKKEEEQRIQRLQQFENQAFSTYDKIHQRLLQR
jgi:curved DNA-binding protein CbpA